MVSTSECPQAEEVGAEIRRLIPEAHLAQLSADLRVKLLDGGETLEVVLMRAGETTSRTYHDPARDCPRRAAFASVFVTLALMPPDASWEPEARAAPQPPSPPRITVAGAVSPTADFEPARLELSAGVLGRGAPPLFHGLPMASLGAGARVAVTTKTLTPFASWVYSNPTDFELDRIRGTFRRWSLAAGLAWRARKQWPRLELSLAAVAAFTTATGHELSRPRTSRTTEWGVRGGLSAILTQARLAPFVALDLDAYPRPSAIRAAPRGELGTTPPLEVATTVGVRLTW